MTANVTFVYAEEDDVLEVPNAALRFRPTPEALAALSSSPEHAHAHGNEHEHAREQDVKQSDRRDGLGAVGGRARVAVDVKIGITDGTTTEIVDGELSHEGRGRRRRALGAEAREPGRRRRMPRML